MGDLAPDQFMCAYCQVQANQRCTGCHETFYCSREHQKLHWKKHKNHCCAFKACTSNLEMGRYIIATRDLKPGELILTESPIVIGPQAVTPPVCLACYKPVNGSYICSRCGWPMCNEACSTSPNHKPECEMTLARGHPMKIDIGNAAKPFPLYETVAIMRCLSLKITSPEKYKALLALEPHTEERKRNGRYDRDRAAMVRVFRQFFALPKEDYSDDEILHICGILFVNAHELPVTFTPTQAIYKNASLVEHSCINNASKHFDMNTNVQIRAAVHIRKGDHISIMYSDPMWGTANRQQHLQETKYFTCTCQRCSDPTELGTEFSSLRCPNSCTGYLSAVSPTASDDDGSSSLWECNVCKKSEVAGGYVDKVIRSIGEELVRLERGVPEACQNFIKKHSQNLHPNHYYLMDVKLALSQMIGQQANTLNELSEKDLVYKQKLCMEILGVANVISPGISRLRGVIMYELQSTLAAYARRKFSSGEISVDHLKNILKEVRKYLKECIQIFSFEPTCIQEGRLAAIARLDLVELETFVDSVEKTSSVAAVEGMASLS